MKSLASTITSLPARFLMGLVKAYRLLLSPWVGNDCRFTPTCSEYSLEALGRHGATVGTYLTLYRLARCQPWCDGGHDPVPKTTVFTRLVAAATPHLISAEKKL
jgi:uncharacterized protein